VKCLVRPIIATENPYDAAKQFEECGWKIDFQTDPDGDDPLAGVSLHGNEILLGTMSEKFTKKEALPYVGAGVEFHFIIAASRLQEAYMRHSRLHPTELKRQPWGEIGFGFTMQGYKFMILSESK